MGKEYEECRELLERNCSWRDNYESVSRYVNSSSWNYMSLDEREKIKDKIAEKMDAERRRLDRR